MKVQTLRQYIDKYFNGSQREFAKAQGVLPQQVTKWLKAEYIVGNDTMYSKRRRELKR